MLNAIELIIIIATPDVSIYYSFGLLPYCYDMNFKEYQRRNIEVICLMLLKAVDVFALLPYEPVTTEKMLLTTTQILGEYLKQN